MSKPNRRITLCTRYRSLSYNVVFDKRLVIREHVILLHVHLKKNNPNTNYFLHSLNFDTLLKLEIIIFLIIQNPLHLPEKNPISRFNSLVLIADSDSFWILTSRVREFYRYCFSFLLRC